MTATAPRRFLSVLEPIVSMIFFSPEAAEEYAALGMDGWSAYFRSRSAAMGAVSAEVVAATFYNFNPELVRANVAWDAVSPEEVYAARLRGVRATLGRLLAGADLGGLPRAVELLREAVAACPPEGRPLAAAHAKLPWPEDDPTALWHGANVLREYRGDGHVAVLVAHRVGPVEAILLQSAYIGVAIDFQRLTRAWDEAAMAAGVARLVERGFVTPEGGLTDAGEKFRLMLEHETDRLAEAPFAALGTARCEELLGILDPLARVILAAKGVPRALGRMDPTNRLA